MDLEIRQHESFQTAEWRAERIGWVAMVLLVLAGAVGLLGAGPLSWTTASSDGGAVQVEYQRVTHHEADDSLTLTFGPEVIEDGTVTVSIVGAWPSGVDVASIVPEPTDQRAIPDGVVMEFAVEAAGETTASFAFRAQDHGNLDAQISAGDQTVSITQLVLP